MPAVIHASPGPLAEELLAVSGSWARSQHRLVVLAAEFAESVEWVRACSPTAAHWLARCADVEVCTAREWIRIGRLLGELPTTAAAFDAGEVSYSKVRTLTRVATPGNEAELLAIAVGVPAGQLGRELARWLGQNTDPDELAELQHRRRSVSWRTDPDGMLTFTLRLPPVLAGRLIAILTMLVMRQKPGRSGPDHASADGWPTLAQQHADAVATLSADGAGAIITEVVVHVRGDGCTLDDGSPVADSDVAQLVPASFIRVLLHDAERRPINASGRRRHPTTRQQRVVKERDRCCVDCGRTDLLEYDHVPAYRQSGRTVVDELRLRCAPCHHQRHQDWPPITGR